MTGRSSIRGEFASGVLSGLFGRRSKCVKPQRARAASRRVEPLESRMLFAISLVSSDATGMAGGVAVVSEQPDVSDDGRFVAFTTAISNVVPGVTEGDADPDVYVRNLQDNTVAGVSVNSSNVAFSGHSPSVSGDGRYVAFVTDVNLAAAGVDTNGQEDVYLWDRTTPGVFTLVSVLANGTAGSGFQPSISTNGRVVAFVSAGTASGFNAGATDGNGLRDVFHRNLDTGVTTLMSATPGGTTAGNGRSDEPEISGDGNFVAFRSLATDLVAGVADGNVDRRRLPPRHRQRQRRPGERGRRLDRGGRDAALDQQRRQPRRLPERHRPRGRRADHDRRVRPQHDPRLVRADLDQRRRPGRECQRRRARHQRGRGVRVVPQLGDEPHHARRRRLGRVPQEPRRPERGAHQLDRRRRGRQRRLQLLVDQRDRARPSRSSARPPTSRPRPKAPRRPTTTSSPSRPACSPRPTRWRRRRSFHRPA